MDCRCVERGYVRSLEEDDFGFPGKVEWIAETDSAELIRCRECGAWWEKLPHYVYGYAWYRTERRYWATEEDAAMSAWQERRQHMVA